MPHLDGTDCCIDVVDVQNVNLIHLIVAFASVNQRCAIFPTSPSRIFKAHTDFHRLISEGDFLTEVPGLEGRSASIRPRPRPQSQRRREKRRFPKGSGRHRPV